MKRPTNELDIPLSHSSHRRSVLGWPTCSPSTEPASHHGFCLLLGRRRSGKVVKSTVTTGKWVFAVLAGVVCLGAKPSIMASSPSQQPTQSSTPRKQVHRRSMLAGLASVFPKARQIRQEVLLVWAKHSPEPSGCRLPFSSGWNLTPGNQNQKFGVLRNRRHATRSLIFRHEEHHEPYKRQLSSSTKVSSSGVDTFAPNN